MQLWIAFLVLSFAAGSRAAATGRPERTAVTIGVCLVVASMFLLRRFS